MRKFVFHDFNSRNGIYITDIYDSKEDAIRRLDYAWSHLTGREQKIYKNADEASFRVSEIEISQEELEAIQSGESEKTLDDYSICDVKNML